MPRLAGKASHGQETESRDSGVPAVKCRLRPKTAPTSQNLKRNRSKNVQPHSLTVQKSLLQKLRGSGRPKQQQQRQRPQPPLPQKVPPQEGRTREVEVHDDEAPGEEPRLPKLRPGWPAAPNFWPLHEAATTLLSHLQQCAAFCNCPLQRLPCRSKLEGGHYRGQQEPANVASCRFDSDLMNYA